MSANELLLPPCPLPPLDNAHLADFWLHSEGFLLLLSVESLCTLSSYDFWLESNSKTLQDVLNTDAWAKGSHCVLKVCIFRCKKGMLGRRRNAVFYYCRVNLTILNFVNCQLDWGLGGWGWGVLFISNI